MFTVLVKSDALSLTKSIKDESVDFIYVDPPYNTGKKQSLSSSVSTVSYMEKFEYLDKFSDFKAFIYPILEQFKRILKPNALLNVHLDYREVHYVKVCLDEIFGRAAFKGEIIWKAELGAVSKTWWANKHSTILQYSKGTPKFKIDNVPQLRKLSDPRGSKLLTSVWDYTPGCAIPRTGYPNEKPEAILRNLLAVHTDPGDLVLDCFGGSGTTAAIAREVKANAIIGDINDLAIRVMESRLNVKAKVIQ